jgi:hypothetical protein
MILFFANSYLSPHVLCSTISLEHRQILIISFGLVWLCGVPVHLFIHDLLSLNKQLLLQSIKVTICHGRASPRSFRHRRGCTTSCWWTWWWCLTWWWPEESKRGGYVLDMSVQNDIFKISLHCIIALYMTEECCYLLAWKAIHIDSSFSANNQNEWYYFGQTNFL